jgi:hypothetical protein
VLVLLGLDMPVGSAEEARGADEHRMGECELQMMVSVSLVDEG